MWKFIPILLLAACSSGTGVQHYVGHVVHWDDVVMSNQPWPSTGVEATFESADSMAVLYVHTLDSSRVDTIKFLRIRGLWHFELRKNDYPSANIRHADDSLYISFGEFTGQTFYLRRTP